MNFFRTVFGLVLGRRLPLTEGELAVNGIAGPVRIRRDAHGIVYVEAGSEDDAWFGLGFCHGQDRTFQIEGLMRVARGTLAELVGKPGLPVDRLSRRIGFRETALKQFAVLNNETRSMLEAYARGVTAGATQGLRRRPHEFALLRARPTTYDAADVLAVLKLMAFSLASNWDSELARLKILTEDGPEALLALDPSYPEWLPVTFPVARTAGAAVQALERDLATFNAAAGLGGGSNSWALSASRTATGRPLLANDPHLASTLPPHWYLAHVRTPEWAVAGAAFVGTPAFAAAHNGTAAWGITAGLVDNTDLFLEEIGPDGRSVKRGDKFVPCDVRTETISVKGAEPVQEEVLITPHGPIVGPAFEGEVGAVSLSATWLNTVPLDGLSQLHRVGSFDEFRLVFDPWPAVSASMVYADALGTIGWCLAGDVPVRRKGCGTIPLHAGDPQIGWETARVPFDSLPHASNPECGFLASANAKPAADGDGPFLGADWVDGYRLARIVEVLDERPDWNLEATLRLQLDELSLPWREIRDIVLAVPAGDKDTKQALEVLSAWDGRVTADSPGAAVFEFFICEMIQRAVRAKAPRSGRWALGAGFTAIEQYTFFALRRVGHIVRLLREQPSGWFARSWRDEMGDALKASVSKLREGQGRDTERWQWGSVRPLTLRHPLGVRAPLGRVFNLGPFSWGGDANTVAQSAVDPANPTVNAPFIASLRMVVDVGNWEENRFVLPGGQSGNPLSPHYDDLLPLWLRGDGVRIAWSEEETGRVAVKALTLMPPTNPPRPDAGIPGSP